MSDWNIEKIDLKDSYMFFLNNDLEFLIKNYKWSWNKEDCCYYNEFGEDITDTVYYDDNDNFYCHPKILASYVSEYLNAKEKVNHYVNY
jgi:hypothetical protein